MVHKEVVFPRISITRVVHADVLKLAQVLLFGRPEFSFGLDEKTQSAVHMRILDHLVNKPSHISNHGTLLQRVLVLKEAVYIKTAFRTQRLVSDFPLE